MGMSLPLIVSAYRRRQAREDRGLTNDHCHLLHVGAVYMGRPHTLSVPTLDSSVIMNRQLTLLLSKQFYRSARSELSMGWVNPRVGLGWVGLDWVGSRFFDFWWVGLGRGSETAETQKLKIFICAEFIEATNVVTLMAMA